MMLWEVTWAQDIVVYFKGADKEEVKAKFYKYITEQRAIPPCPYLDWILETVQIERSKVIL